MNRTIFLAAWIVLLAAASPINARAQSLSISGVVLDQSGATIPGALITLRKGEETQTAQTGTAGSFSFAGIGPGNPTWGSACFEYRTALYPHHWP
jgi:Carboxypeptidase regulatory-like domain